MSKKTIKVGGYAFIKSCRSLKRIATRRTESVLIIDRLPISSYWMGRKVKILERIVSTEDYLVEIPSLGNFFWVYVSPRTLTPYHKEVRK